MTHCDGCNKDRRDVRACGQDAAGVADAPCLCFLCRVEDARGRCYSTKHGRYVPYELLEAEAQEAELEREASRSQE